MIYTSTSRPRQKEGPTSEHCHRRDPDHRCRHPSRRATRPVDLPDAQPLGRSRSPTSNGTPASRKRRGSSVTSGWRRSASAAQAGWPEFPPDHPRRWSDADPVTWDPKLRLGRMDEYGIHAQILYPNVALFNSSLLQGVADDLAAGAVPPGVQRLSDRLQQRGARPLSAHDLTAVLGPRRHPQGDRPLHGGRPQGHRVLAGSLGLRAAAAHRPPLGSHVGQRPGEGPSGQLPHRLGRHDVVPQLGPSRQRSPRQLRVDGRVLLHGQRQDDRAADLRRHLPPLPRAELRLGRERRRVDPLRPRFAGLAVAELRCRRRSTPSTTCCRASTSSARSTAASGSSGTRPCSRSSAWAPTTFSTRPTSRTRRACRRARRRRPSPRPTTSKSTFSGLPEDTLRKILHDNAARIYHLD